jgi:soluble lytic murein transglycosylase-like protein
MQISLVPRLLVLAAASAVAASPCAAGEVSAPAPAAYRLNIAEPHSVRLFGEVPASARTEPAIPPLLAERPYAALISNAAHKTSLDPALVHAVIFVESRYQAAARSPKGAIGLMQVLRETAARYGVADPARSPEANVTAGTRYLQDLMQLFDGQLDLVLAAYNAGENAVVRHGHRIPPYRETQHYVPAVLAKYREWRGPTPPAGAQAAAPIEYLPGTRLDLKALATALH